MNTTHKKTIVKQSSPLKRMLLAITVTLTALTGCSKTTLTESSLGNDSIIIKSSIKRNTTVAGIGQINDPNIKYFGRWDFSNSTQYISYWGGAYIKVNFTGTTVKLKVGNTTNYFVRIDNGPWVSYLNASGTVNLTPTPLTAGTHTLSVAQGKDYNYVFNFQGLILDPGATTAVPNTSTNIIEYIGDSITAGYTDPQANVSAYGWICSEALGAEHTQIAYPGICLASGYTTNPGMDGQYFKLQSAAYPSSPNWNFATYTPKAIVINLGTNDNNKSVPDNIFQSTYITFLANIRTKFPNAEIFVLRTFKNLKTAPTIAAVNARNAAGDVRIHYINTDGWLTAASDYTDGLHPSVSGNIKVANFLKPILAPYVGGSQALANGTYKIVNKNSGLAIDAQGQGTTNGTPILQWPYSGNNNQRWTITSLGGGQYKIIGVQSGRALDVTGASTTNGAKLQLYDSNNTNAQKWIIISNGSGHYTVQAVHSGKLLEVNASSTTQGALIQQWHYNGNNNQLWAFQTP